jgi:hypothetical protein
MPKKYSGDGSLASVAPMVGSSSDVSPSRSVATAPSIASRSAIRHSISAFVKIQNQESHPNRLGYFILTAAGMNAWEELG